MFAWVAVASAVTGCDQSLTRFPANEIHRVALERSRGIPTAAAARDVDAVVTRLFGTPSQPRWPAAEMSSDPQRELIDVASLKVATGDVASDQQDDHVGLYREHCVTCHGVAGGGDGAAAYFQLPYPRDFRHGVFKWKSTTRAAKPTRDDLTATLRRGVPGSGMPSFANLRGDDLRALVDYTIYLSVRGQFERELLAAAVDDLGYDESAPDDPDVDLAAVAAAAGQQRSTAADVVQRTLDDVTGDWVRASEQVVPVPPVPAEVGRLHQSIITGDATEAAIGGAADRIARGDAIFHGQIANCVGCHGPGGRGGVDTLDYDDWTKEYTTRIGVTPTDRDAVGPLRAAGALPPRPISPRHLDIGVYRGGGSPEDLYRRVSQGIAGAPMPAVMVTPQQSPQGLTADQVWDLVAYVMSITHREVR